MEKLLMKTDLARLLQDFFCLRLIQQRNVSHQTVCSYRDTFRLLLHFCEQQLKKPAVDLQLIDIDAPLVLAFLNHLESHRHNCIRSRNTRLAGIQQVLAIPLKRFDRPMVGHLTLVEMQAILDAPDKTTWSGRRDYVLLSTLYNSGARVSEIIALRRIDFESTHSQAIHLHGKGRKQRVVPLWKRTVRSLKKWLSEIGSEPQQPLFPNRFGQMLSRSGVESRLKMAVTNSIGSCPSLKNKTISPHIITLPPCTYFKQAWTSA